MRASAPTIKINIRKKEIFSLMKRTPAKAIASRREACAL
jgi:hypothetical protein